MKAIHLWALWQALVLPFARCFTRPGFRRFVEWLTGLVLRVNADFPGRETVSIVAAQGLGQ